MSRSLVPLVLALVLPACLLAQGQTISPVNAWQHQGGLSDQYSDFNTHMIQIQTVKSIPFFNKTPTERMSAIRGYYSEMRQGNLRNAGTSLRSDWVNGGLVTDVAIGMATQVFTQV